MNKKNLYINRILLFLFVLLLPTQFGKHFFFPWSYISGVRVDYLAPTVYFTDILALLICMFNYRLILKYLQNKTFLLVVVILLLPVIFAGIPFVSLYYYLKYLLVIGVSTIYGKKILSLPLIVVAFTTGALGELILSVLQMVNGHTMQGLWYFLGERALMLSTPGVAKTAISGTEILRPYGTFSHPNSLAGFYLLVYVFALFSPDKVQVKNIFLYKTIKFVCVLSSLLLVLFSFSKLAISVFIIVYIIYVIQHNQKVTCPLCVASKLLIPITLSLVFVTAQGDPLSFIKRLDLVRDSIAIMLQHPFFGVGFGNYVVFQQAFPIMYPFFFLQPVHNIVLLWITETGLLVTFVLIYVLKKPIIMLFKNRYTVLIAFVILATGMGDHYWLTLQQNMYIAGIIGSLALASSHR